MFLKVEYGHTYLPMNKNWSRKNPSFKRHVWLYDQADIVGLNQSLSNIGCYTWYN